jgi:hypothetical protein
MGSAPEFKTFVDAETLKVLIITVPSCKKCLGRRQLAAVKQLG